MADRRGLITLIGWIFTLGGLAPTALPDAMKSVGERMLEKPAMLAPPAAVMAIIGAYLSWEGCLGLCLSWAPRNVCE